MGSFGIDGIIEKDFLKKNLQDFRTDGSYCYGYVNGEKYEEVIEQVLALSSTCFVTTESHFRPKGHKRYSETGKMTFSGIIGTLLLHITVYYCYYQCISLLLW